MSENLCKQCGKCCEVIVLSVSMERIKDLAYLDNGSGFTEKESDVIFIAKNWSELSKKDAISRNPHIKTWKGEGDIDNNEKYFYECLRFNRETRKCSAYESRPKVCSGFPYYGKKINPKNLYSPECGFVEENKKIGDIQDINNALGIELKPWQIDYIFDGEPIPEICPCIVKIPWIDKENIKINKGFSNENYCSLRGRRIGKTLAYCIRIILGFSDDIHFKDFSIRREDIYILSDECFGPSYSTGCFRKMFLDTQDKLTKAGFNTIRLIRS